MSPIVGGTHYFTIYSNNLFINHFIHTVLSDLMDNLGIVFFENWRMHSADFFYKPTSALLRNKDGERTLPSLGPQIAIVRPPASESSSGKYRLLGPRHNPVG